MKWPKVSVIIPFYKGTDWLIEALDSVFLQNYPNIEILVINDGSPEELHAVEEKYLNRVIWINQQNSGPAAARNAGIDAATGKYVALLDADDIWFENYEVVKEQLEKGVVLDTKHRRWLQRQKKADISDDKRELIEKLMIIL